MAEREARLRDLKLQKAQLAGELADARASEKDLVERWNKADSAADVRFNNSALLRLYLGLVGLCF